MSNMPEVKIGVVAVSRDCFPESLSVTRRANLMKAYTEKYGQEGIYECPVCIVESEIHMVQALEDIKAAGCNALVVYGAGQGRRILRYAERKLQSEASQRKGIHSGISGRGRRRMCGYDS